MYNSTKLTVSIRVRPAFKSVVERQKSHVNPGVAAKAGEAVKRNK